MISNYTQFQLVFTDQNSVIAVWRESYDEPLYWFMETKAESYHDNYARKHPKVGSTFEGIITNESTSINFGTYTGNDIFTSEFNQNTITMLLFDTDNNKKFQKY